MNKPAAPPILWHYTDASGLFGIVESAQLRFSDVRFLNDCTERVHAESLLSRLFAAEIATDDHDGAVSEVQRHTVSYNWVRWLCVCSFSATKDSISQWQRYGAGGAGYCIGFRTADLDTVLSIMGVLRVRISYDDDEQSHILRTAIRESTETFRNWSTDGVDSKIKAELRAISVAEDVNAATLCIKNVLFRDEQEWRYIFRHGDELHMQYAVRGHYIKPFIQLPTRSARPPLVHLPIAAIVCGPRLERNIAVPTVQEFVKSRQYRDVAVEASVLADVWR